MNTYSIPERGTSRFLINTELLLKTAAVKPLAVFSFPPDSLNFKTRPNEPPSNYRFAQ